MPETGFGYIECAAIPVGTKEQAVRRFVEKPPLEQATEYVAAGNYLWNSGMFCFTARAMLDALQRHAPAVLAAARAAVERGIAPALDPRRVLLDASAFAQAPDISIDYAVMERESNVVVLAGDFGWSDIGSWKAVAEEFERDAGGNTTSGDVLLADCVNVHAQTRGQVDRRGRTEGRRHRRHRRRCAGVRPARIAEGEGCRQRIEATRARHAQAASNRHAPVGHLHHAAGRPELQDQADRSEAGCIVVAADAPSSQRTLGRRQRNREGHDRRARRPAGAEPVDLRSPGIASTAWKTPAAPRCA